MGHHGGPLGQFVVNQVAQWQLGCGNKVETLTNQLKSIMHCPTYVLSVDPGLNACVLTSAYRIKVIFKMYPQNALNTHEPRRITICRVLLALMLFN